MNTSNKNLKGEIHRLIDNLRKVQDSNRERRGKERISAVYENKEPDYLPIILDQPAHVTNYCTRFTLREQFFCKYKMLYETLGRMIETAKVKSDGQLCIRVNFGVVLIPSIFGVVPEVPEDTMPWCKEPLTKQKLSRFKIPSDISKLGLIGRALEYMSYFREELQGLAHVYAPDTQGPFDIAHLVYGDRIFTDLYDDPEFVHHLLQLCTEMYIKATKLFKEVIGEPFDSAYHGHGMSMGIYLPQGGARVSEDTATLLSPNHIAEFAIPYDQQALRPFGGGFIHFCGYKPELLDQFLQLPEVKGINLGNPESYPLGEIMRKFLSLGKFYFGNWKRKDEESLHNYFVRIISSLEEKKGLIFLLDKTNLQEDNPLFAIELWHQIQKHAFG